MKNKLSNALLVGLVFLVGCASLGTAVTNKNNQVQMSHYSIVIPPDAGWYLQVAGGPYEQVQVAMDPMPFVMLRMRWSRNTILIPQFRTATAKHVADNFREGEKNIMIERGVKTGMYTLSPVEMYDKEVEGKRFYAMRYTANTPTRSQTSWLYLFFPKDANNDWFIMAHYSVAAPKDEPVDTREADFLRVLASLEVR